MADYIDRDKLLAKQVLAYKLAIFEDDVMAYKDVGFTDTFAVDADDIVEADAEDVAPVIHGRWKRPEGDKYCGYLVCSNCENVFIGEDWPDDGKYKYCPGCGCKMDLEEAP